LVSLFVTWQGVISDGNKKEASLSAQYASGQTVLSSCIVKTDQAAATAVAQSDKLKEIFTAAVTGRYSTGSSTAIDNGKLFSAISEAYPNTAGLDKTFQLVLSTITGCRDDYANQQIRVQDELNLFNSWRTGSFTVRLFGGEFPNQNLYVKLGDATLRGQDALDKIAKPIIDNGTLKAYQDGTFNVGNPFGSPTPTPNK
jgi:hypothetical protein